MNHGKEIGELIGMMLLIVILIIFGPLFSFWIAFFGGWIVKITFGAVLCNALNILFNTAYFVPSMLPWMAGALGWIGGFFKSVDIARRKKDK